MLKITRIDENAGGTHWVLEGRLVGPWVNELEKTLLKEGGVQHARIDVAGIGFVDAQGLKLLQRLQKSGAVLESASAFLRESLKARH